MQVTQTLNEGLKRGYDITITAAELDEKVDAKLKEAQPQVEIKGFRKGKVPMPLLKKQFGKRLLGEVMEESIDGAMQDHFKASGDRPALQPDVKMTNEDWKEGDDIEVSMTYEALPDIPEVDLKAIKLEKMVVKADDAAVDEALNDLAKTAQIFEDRAEGTVAENGDQVVFDFKGFVDGAPFDGGAAEDYPLTLGSDAFIPGFEDQLVGAVAGTEMDVTVTFPDDYGADALKGKEARFECKIKAVKAPLPCPIDDEMAKKFGAEDLTNLKKIISERLEAEYAEAARALQKRALLDALDQAVSFDLPETLVKSEADQIARGLADEENSGDANETDEITPTEAQTKLAERRVRLGLVLADIGGKAGVTVSETEMNQAILRQARQFPGEERQFFEFVSKDAMMQQQIRSPLFEEKVVDYAFELAEVSEKAVSKDDLKQAIDAVEDDDV